MTISEEQANAYFAAEYRVFVPGGDVIRFQARGESPALAALHRARNVPSSAFITAYNPRSRPTDESINRRNQERLLAEIGACWEYLLGEGADPKGLWPPEPSLLVLGIGLEDALDLGRRYGQNTIVFADAGGRTDLHACHPGDRPGPPPA